MRRHWLPGQRRPPLAARTGGCECRPPARASRACNVLIEPPPSSRSWPRRSASPSRDRPACGGFRRYARVRVHPRATSQLALRITWPNWCTSPPLGIAPMANPWPNGTGRLRATVTFRQEPIFCAGLERRKRYGDVVVGVHDHRLATGSAHRVHPPGIIMNKCRHPADVPETFSGGRRE